MFLPNNFFISKSLNVIIFSFFSFNHSSKFHPVFWCCSILQRYFLEILRLLCCYSILQALVFRLLTIWASSLVEPIFGLDFNILAHCRSTISTRDINITLYIIKHWFELPLMQDVWHILERIRKSRTNIVLCWSQVR